MSTKRLYPEGLLGKKLGMSHIFTEEGNCVPVTVLEVGPCYIVDLKNPDQHGYSAVRIGFEPKKAQRVNKPEMGTFTRAGKGAFYHSKEIRCDAEALGWETLGQELSVSDIFQVGQKVDVTGTSIGRGFTGVVKKWGVKGQPASRGTHEYFRHIGAVGCRKTPGHIYKNKHMPGHYGNETITVQNLKIVSVKPEQNILLVKGAVPGPKGSFITVKKAMKGYQPLAASKSKAA